MAQRIAALAALVLAASALPACGGRAPQAEQFVGKWRSSRMATAPLELLANGEWEIRAADGQVMQYGVWQLDGRRIFWTIKQGERLQHDANAILSVDARRFELRESDGSVTRFERLD